VFVKEYPRLCFPPSETETYIIYKLDESQINGAAQEVLLFYVRMYGWRQPQLPPAAAPPR